MTDLLMRIVATGGLTFMVGVVLTALGDNPLGFWRRIGNGVALAGMAVVFVGLYGLVWAMNQ